MFEHMSNWRALLDAGARLAASRDGPLFIHVFTHRTAPYRFDVGDKADWIAQHFFTGGIMPSHGLIRAVRRLFAVEEEWRWSGDALRSAPRYDWLANFDRNIAGDRADPARRLRRATPSCGERRWRLFFLATAGLFGQPAATNGASATTGSRRLECCRTDSSLLDENFFLSAQHAA